MGNFYKERENAFHERYYKQLEGASIHYFVGMNEGFPTFELLLSNGQVARIEISRDPEGNGGGFIFGLLSPDMSDWNAKQAALSAELEAENV